MKDWEDIIKERQLSRKAELPESDWNDFLSRQAEHERAARRRHRLIAAAISFPAAAAVLLLLFLMPFKTVAPDNQISQNEPSEPQITIDSLANPIDSIAIEKPQVEIAQVKPQVKPESKPEKKPESNSEIRTGATVFGGSTSQRYGSRMVTQNTSSVKGSIYDFDSAEPMYSAAVMIYSVNGADTTYIGGTSTDENGEFVFDKLRPGNYIANARFMGYDDVHKSFTIRPDEDNHNLGKITIRGGSLLSGLAVNAVVAKVQMVNDTVQFNSAAYRLPEGTSVEDLVRKLPGVEIDSVGNITVNGKSIQRILVNGKEFFSEEKQKELTQLTAEMIEKVKAYEKQSDLSRQTGIDDGREELVMELQFVGMLGGITSTFKKPLILFDGEVVDVPEDKVTVFDFSNSYNDRDSLSNLLGVRRGKINVVNAISGEAAVAKWGPSAENGVLQVMSGRYYRKSLRAGKLLYGTYEFIPRTKRSK
ncbi:MAG: carboxypeptidase regulatory-like domain-containing protein [Bacteroidaceae bacterium]|nr:carboxypeptidase regulatory-like domain-containing protein [Bacteroidaceae bacterium]